MTYSRPAGAYAGSTGSNRTKYQDDSAANTAISSAKVDGDLNYIIDSLNGFSPLTDGDKGDITVSSSGATFTIDNLAVTTGKIADDAVTLAKQASGTANRLQGFNGSGDPAEVSVGTGLNLSGGSLTATSTGDAIPSGSVGANLYNFGGCYPSSSGTRTLSADTLYATIFFVGASTTFTRIGVNVTTLAGGSSIRLGIYNVADGRLSSLVLDAGTVSSASTGEKEATISQALSPGIYALVAVSNGTPDLRTQALPGSSPWAAFVFQQASISGSAHGLSGSFTYGTLPSTGPSLSNDTNSTPLMWLRKV